MKIPPSRELMKPVLQALDDGKQAHRSTIRDRVRDILGLTEDDIRQETGRTGGRRGKRPVFGQRLEGAFNRLKRAGFLRGSRGEFQITEKGQQSLSGNPSHADLAELAPTFRQLRARRTSAPSPVAESTRHDSSEEGPEDALIRIGRKHTDSLVHEILECIRADKSGQVLEYVARDLLVAMGYGDVDGANRTGGPGDGGIDGVIQRDEFGLDLVCYQAKNRESGKVGGGALRDFAGALVNRGASKGLFITTASGFSREAEKYAKESPMQIVLVDGEKLARLMIRYNVGVRSDNQLGSGTEALECTIKHIDEGYFEGSW